MIFYIFQISKTSTPFAYLDPGSGSFVIQLLLAALLGGGFIIKSSWRKIRIFYYFVISGKNIEEVDEDEE